MAYISSGKGQASATLDSTGATFIAVFIASDSSFTVSDNKGNASWQYGTAGNYGRWAWHESPTVGTSHTITTPVGYAYVFAIAFTGVDATPDDGENGNNNVTANAGGPYTFTNGSVTPSQAGDLFLAGISLGNSAGYSSIDSSFTTVQSQTGAPGTAYGGAIAYKEQSGGAAAENPTWTTTAPGSNTAHTLRMQAFKTASGGGSSSGAAAYYYRQMQ